MSSRKQFRKKALEILYEAQQRNISALNLLEERTKTTQSYTKTIVEGVICQQKNIDEYLQTYSQGWDLERMPIVDLNILRIGLWELLYNEDVPDVVAIHEAVALAKLLSTDDSPKFINGVLGTILQLKPTLTI